MFNRSRLDCALLKGLLALSAASAFGQPLHWTAPKPLSDYAAIDGHNEMSSWSASDGQGTVVTIYSSSGGLAGSRSTDEGQSWSPVLSIITSVSDSVVDAGIAYAGQNVFVALWLRTNSEGIQLLSNKSIDSGVTWSAPVVVLGSDTGSLVDIASDGNGTLFACSKTRLLKSFDFGDTWTLTAPYSSPYFNGTYKEYAQIAYNGAGKWVHVYDSWVNRGVGGLDGYFPAYYAGVSTDGTNWTKVPVSQITKYDVAASGDSFGIAALAGSTSAADPGRVSVIKSWDGGVTWEPTTTVGSNHEATLSIASSGDKWLLMCERLDSGLGFNVMDGFTSANNMDSWTHISRGAILTPETDPSVTVATPGNFLVSYCQLQKASPLQLGPDWDIKADKFSSLWTGGAFVNNKAATDIPIIEDTNVKMDSRADGTIVAVWTASGFNDDADVFYARSEDGGETWSNSAPLNSDYATDTRNDLDGNIVYVGGDIWYAYFTGQYSKSIDNGISWSSPAPISLPDDQLNYITVAANQSGLMFLANSYIQSQTIYKSNNGGKSWIKVDAAHPTGWVNSMIHTGGTSWLGIIGSSALISDNNGSSWEIINPQPALNLAGMNDLKSDHNGTLMAISSGVTFNPSDAEFIVWSATSINNGRNWTTQGIFNQHPFPFNLRPFTSTLASIGGNSWIATWLYPGNAMDTKDFHAWSSYSTDAGTSWDSPQQVGPHTFGDQDQGGISAVGTEGKSVVAWHTITTPETIVAPTGRDADIFITTADSHPVIIPPTPVALTDVTLGIKLSFNKAFSDSCQLSGNLPIPAGFNPAGKVMSVDVGGILRVFTLDSKGNAKAGNDSFRLKIKSKKGVVEAQLASFKVQTKKSILSVDLDDEGLLDEDVKNVPVQINVSIAMDSKNFSGDKTLLYSAKAGKTGKAK